jgi:hypothetical protein
MILKRMLDKLGPWILLSGSCAVAGAQSANEGIKVTMDVKPGDNPTVIQPRRGGMLPVAVLTTGEFDAARVDVGTVRLGAEGTEGSVFRTSSDDVDNDGDADLLLLFRMEELGLKCSDTMLRLNGQTTDGMRFWAEEAVEMEGCR